MADDGRTIRFVLNGERLELSRGQVDRRIAGLVPEPIRKHAVRINGTWFPVRQAFEAATGIPRSAFISHTASNPEAPTRPPDRSRAASGRGRSRRSGARTRPARC